MEENEEDMYELGDDSANVWRDRMRQTYADAARPDREASRFSFTEPDLTVTDLGALSGMQRIIRNLALRQDIPDEWWAEAGVSRVLSPDAI
jgi:hypothetical protein